MKRKIALLLSVIMTVSGLSTNVFAAGSNTLQQAASSAKVIKREISISLLSLLLQSSVEVRKREPSSRNGKIEVFGMQSFSLSSVSG